MKRSYFVVGTDTGVGKTAIAVGLVQAARSRGLQAVGMKPVESGCARVAQQLVPQDAWQLLEAAGNGHRLDQVCLYQFEPAVAPGVAAEQSGVTIDFEIIAAAMRRLHEQRPDLLVVEGAGGLLVPLGSQRTIADLVAHLGLPVLVVGRAGLGTINHTLLTLEGLRRRGIAICAVVLVATEPIDPDFAASNASEIARAGVIEVVGVAPYLPKFEQTQMTAWVDRYLLDQLL